VLIATPSTLVALLRTVAIYWQQLSMAENAQRIAEAAQTLYKRTADFAEHLDRMGKELHGAVDAYNKAMGTFEHRLLPMAERLRELKVAEQVKKTIESPRVVDEQVRTLNALPEQQSVFPD
jgi:DNA recombination protein RmuC